jgi:F-box and leucine-rich repeat protein 1 (S-phase kinase-associated protein 2)
MEQLNVAGFRQGLTDTHVEVIVSRCPRLIDLDLSDCQDITMAIESITTLTNLQHLALSRCYSLEAATYALLGNMRSLRYLEVFSFFKESALKTLKSTLPGVEINQFYFSAVARPTVGIRRSTIWTARVRD